MKAEMKEDGLCYFEDGTVIDSKQCIEDNSWPLTDLEAMDSIEEGLKQSADGKVLKREKKNE